MVVETNMRFGEGYQVRVIGGKKKMDIIDFSPYSLQKAVLMAEKALSIINRRQGTSIKLKDVLRIDRDSVIHNSNFDTVSEKLKMRMFGEEE